MAARIPRAQANTSEPRHSAPPQTLVLHTQTLLPSPNAPHTPTNRKTAPSVCTSYTSLHRTPDRTTIAPPPPIDDTP